MIVIGLRKKKSCIDRAAKFRKKLPDASFFVSRLRKEMRRISSKRHDHVKAMQGYVLKRFSVCKMYVKLFDIFVP